VREVRGNARRVHDVVEAQLRDVVDILEQQRERLADAARGAEHGDLVQLQWGWRK